jgi:uncharacterized protein (DUF849 family)
MRASPGEVRIVEAALNGGRGRQEQPRVPYTPAEVAAEALRCASAGASVVHLHARGPNGAWSADPVWYAETLRRLRAGAPDLLVSITSLRPQGVPVDVKLELLAALAADPATRPDLISVNLGHIVAWERADDGPRTLHLPNDFSDVLALLRACARHGVTPELGIMDVGFVSNAVRLRDDGALPSPPWFLLERGPGCGVGQQSAPATPATYDLIAALLREHFASGAFAAHGEDIPTYTVLLRALKDGAHLRVGFED